VSQNKKLWLKFIGIIFLLGLALLVDYPKGPDININRWRVNIDRKIKLHLGLDLQGGTRLVYQADLSNIKPEEYDQAVSGVRDVLERRVNTFGVNEPIIQTAKVGGDYRVIIELPGIKDIKKALDMIGETPFLELQEVIEAPVPTEEGKPQIGFKPTGLSGEHLKHARVEFDQQTGKPRVALEFDDEGKKLFADITKRNIGKQVAIFLDGVPISIPTVQEEIKTGEAVITGTFTLQEAKDLTMRLNSGALPVPIKLISQQNIGPTLGKISIQKSIIAGTIGILLVTLYMVFFYKVPGLISSFTLFIYASIVFALFKLIPITLTLAGVAGFILSIGIAVDASILVFERIKEELRKGGTKIEAIEQGFSHAWNSIRDSNLSSLITCVILSWFGTSLVRGFAITLGLGVLCSIFCSMVVLRVFLILLGKSRILRKFVK